VGEIQLQGTLLPIREASCVVFAVRFLDIGCHLRNQSTAIMSAFSPEEWTDVVPVPQDDGPDPVVAIAYNPEFRMLMDYFRAMLKSQEYSQRALMLTQAILQQNAANYTVWQYRRDCLQSLSADLNAELDYVDGFAEDNPKTYQIWNHRREIVGCLQDASRELAFTEKVFSVDAKNYHAWAHRQWALKTFSLWDGEIEFVEALLQDDIRNNSAWNQRWFVVHNGQVGGATERTQPAPAVCAAEIAFAWNALQKARNNESVWNYLRGWAMAYPALQPGIRENCDALVAGSEGGNSLAVGLCADLWELEGSEAGREKAAGCFALLMDIDKIRAKSWRARFEALS